MFSRPTVPGSGRGTQRARRAYRRLPGELRSADFLRGVLENVRDRLPNDLNSLHPHAQGSLIKFFDEEPLIHFELWLHGNRGRVELGLHFETRDTARNRCLLDFVADDLVFLKDALGQGLEAERWDKGWTRLYISYPLERLDGEEVTRLAKTFAMFIQTLEPIRREAIEACPTTASPSRTSPLAEPPPS